MESYILNFAPNGMVPTKSMNANTPISTSEISEDILMAAEYGASIAHIHARDERTGEPPTSIEIYGSIIEKIRKFNKEIILCVSLSGRNMSDPKLRSRPLALDGDVKPDMGSLTLSSLNFSNQASINAPQTINYLSEEMMKNGIFPEIEIFDLGMANYLNFLLRKKLIPENIYGNILLGNIFGAQPTFSHIASILSNLPKNMITSFAGLGEYQLSASVLALASGHGVRIGLEDNIWYDRDKKIPASNLKLIERITSIAKNIDKTPLSPKKVRELLGLNPGNGKYGYIPQ